MPPAGILGQRGRPKAALDGQVQWPQSAQQRQRLKAGVAIGDQPARLLERLDGGDGLRTHPAIDAAGIKTRAAKAVLQFLAFLQQQVISQPTLVVQSMLFINQQVLLS